MPGEWVSLGAVKPTELSSARLELHWATQLASAVGASLLEPRSDYVHTTLEWSLHPPGLVGLPTEGAGVRAWLGFEDLALGLLAPDGRLVAECSLAAMSLAAATDWLAGALGKALGDASSAVGPPTLQRPQHELPAHPVQDGGVFWGRGRQAREELARWFADAHLALQELAPAVGKITEARVWPHHFDVARLIELDEGSSGEAARSIGVGMSPGDDSYAEPYFYVTPWPYPKGPVTGSLPSGGQWHTEGWTGAVLTGSALLAQTEDSQQVVSSFLEAGIHAALALLG